MYDVVQLAGTLLILTAFIAGVTGRMSMASYWYLALNAVGSVVLTGTAIISVEWGFLLLEGVWALVSIYSILRKALGHSAVITH